ncbi:MAG: hypothetical protein IJK69_05455 [Oscillospiraceae bacterium]|nr:hypothetical protein [Oscillospiraceae bacterium]
MDRIEWEISMDKLRQGKLQLPDPEENGLSQYAGGAIYELRQYIAALEHGYRAQAETLRLYRAQTSRGDSLGKLMENQWSNDAALGYAAMGMRAAQIRPDQGVLALDAMMEAMEHYSLEEARNYERGLREGDGSDGGTGAPSPTETRDGGDGGQGSGRPTGAADGEMPRVVGPSAEFVPEDT